MAQASSAPFAVKILPRSSLATSFKLTSAVGGAALPFTIGHAFKKGDVPAGADIAGSIPDLQVVGKNWWPDGSLKFALISGRATLAKGVAQTISLSGGSAASGSNLTTAQLKASGITAAVDAGIFGNASWSGGDWDAPFMSWVSGPVMSSWIYRKQIGTDAHLVAWLEVRLYTGGTVEVLPWIENGYLKVAGPTNKSAVYSFSMGGTQRFSASINLPNHCRTVLISGSALSYWFGVDPGITPKHDAAYLQSTRLVPSYRANVPNGGGVIGTLAQTYTPLQQGNYPTTMGDGGYDPSIGILPQWDVLYLTSPDTRAYAGVIVNGYGAGRYGIHFRDEATNRPLRLSSHPNLVLNGRDTLNVPGTGTSSTGAYTPVATGTWAQVWASTHHPSVGFMAYLISGRFYFMEQLQFAATIHYLKNSDNARGYAKGIIHSNAGSNTIRGTAWATRTLAQAACITPDNDTPLRTEFLTSLEENINAYHGYVELPNGNQFGFVAPYSDYSGTGDNKYTTPIWQEDFFTAAYGYTLDMDPAISATGKTKLREFFAWKARSIIGRLGGTAPTDYLYRDAAQYTVAIAPSDSPDFSNGPWYADWGKVYAATVGAVNTGVAGELRGGNFPEPTSYWGNLQPAIAYAVEHNVPGARDAYNRMVGASNWNQIVLAWNDAPVWSVKPRNV